jgi:sugar/nucleoside kinase (ribokinase family)
MTTPIYDVCGIGSAIVDVLAKTDDQFITDQGLLKGGMMLIDEERAESLYEFMTDATECSGGSVGNTIGGIASLGGTPAFIGKIKQDVLGEAFRGDMRSIGVHFDTPAALTGAATARCYIFVTPDAQRTMNTYLGACTGLSEADMNDALIARSQVTYVEGYLWDMPHTIAAIKKAYSIARTHKRKCAFTLSDLFCVERHREEFLELLPTLDILFANEAELLSLMQTTDFEKAKEAIRGRCPVIALTRSDKGSVVVTATETIEVQAEKGLTVVDTTGAGDLYASGFLYGITQGWELRKAAELATKCASLIIQQIGARPAKPLTALKNK